MTRHPVERFRTVFQGTDGETVTNAFMDKAMNDQFYTGMKVMGVTGLVKEYYQPAMGDWFRYHNENQQVLDNSVK